MDSKRICVDDKNYVAPEVMFGTMPVVIYEQDARDAGCGGIKHRHSETQLSVVTEGSVKFILQDCEWVLKKGDVIFINSNREHETTIADAAECKYFCVKFNPAVISGGGNYGLFEKYIEPVTCMSSNDAILFDDAAAEKAAELIAQLVELYVNRNPHYEIEINITLQKLWLIVYELFEKDDMSLKNASFSEKMRIDTLCDFIHKNYSEKITLDDIANAAHISKGECCRIFKKLFRTTPFQYLVYYRLLQSIELLTETDYSISQIAQHVGFCSSSYYTKCFRNEFNSVPHKFRQNAQKFNGTEQHKKINN